MWAVVELVGTMSATLSEHDGVGESGTAGGDMHRGSSAVFVSGGQGGINLVMDSYPAKSRPPILKTHPEEFHVQQAIGS